MKQMKQMKYLLSAIFLIAVVYGNTFAAPAAIGQVQNVNRSKREVVVWVKNRSALINMYDKLAVVVNKKVIQLTVTNPMGTVARCSISGKDARLLSQFKKGMPVYRYRKGIESQLVSDSRKTRLGNSTFIVKSSHRSDVFLINLDDWYQIIKRSQSSTMSNPTIKKLTIDTILNPKASSGKDTMSIYLHAIGYTNQKTTATVKSLPKGNYLVWVVGNGKVDVKEVFLGDRATETVDFDLRERTLSVTTNPGGATVYIDGVRMPDKTPVPISLPAPRAGYYIVKVTKSGYYTPQEKRVYIQPGQKETIHFNLSRRKSSSSSSGCFSSSSSSRGDDLNRTINIVGVFGWSIEDNSSTMYLGGEMFIFFGSSDLVYIFGGAYYGMRSISDYDYSGDTYDSSDLGLYMGGIGLNYDFPLRYICGFDGLGFIQLAIDFDYGYMSETYSSYDYLDEDYVYNTMLYGVTFRTSWEISFGGSVGMSYGFNYGLYAFTDESEYDGDSDRLGINGYFLTMSFFF